MLISTVIVSWNTRDLTLAAVESVLGQQVAAELEVVVVDNGSADDTVAALRERFPQVVVIATGRNLGFAGGNNVGLRRARGEFTLLLNSDAALRPGALQALLEVARAHPTAVLQPKLILPDGSIQYVWNYIPSLARELWLALVVNRWVRRPGWQRKVAAWRGPRTLTAVGLAALWVPRIVWRRVGLLSTKTFLFFEESDLSTRLRRRHVPMLLVPAAVIDHYQGRSTGQVPHVKRRAHFLSRLWYYRTHQAPWQAAAVGWLTRARAAFGLLTSPAAADELWRPIWRASEVRRG